MNYLLYLIKVVYLDNVNQSSRYNNKFNFNNPNKTKLEDEESLDSSNNSGCQGNTNKPEFKPENDEVLKKIKQHGIEIHARSVFLQGLLLMPLHKLPAYFSKIYGNLEKFMIYAHELSLSNIELALGFVQSIEEVDKVIIGVNTVDQLYKIIDASKVKVNQNSYFDLAVFDTDYTNPSNWRL